MLTQPLLICCLGLGISLAAAEATIGMSPEDQAEAAAYLAAARQAGEGGDANALYTLGLLYADDNGKPKEPVLALQAFQKSADLGYADGQDALGNLLLFGDDGVAKDEIAAVRWFRLAAAQGHAGAQDSLGSCYRFGWGVPLDLTESVRWYRLSAEHANDLGMNDLGDALHEGRGTARDDVAAYAWLAQVSEFFCKPERRAAILDALPADRQAEARRQAEELARRLAPAVAKRNKRDRTIWTPPAAPQTPAAP